MCLVLYTGSEDSKKATELYIDLSRYFSIRQRADGQTFALTLSFEGQMRHYFILVNDGETYSMEHGQRFKALIIVSICHELSLLLTDFTRLLVHIDFKPVYS